MEIGKIDIIFCKEKCFDFVLVLGNGRLGGGDYGGGGSYHKRLSGTVLAGDFTFEASNDRNMFPHIKQT